MWKYILILAVFNVGYGMTLLTTPNRIGGWTGVGAVLFIIVGVACLIEVIYRWRGRNLRTRLLLRVVVQSASFLIALLWFLFIVILLISAHGPANAIFSWVLILVGQALMIRLDDVQGADELKRVIDEEKSGGGG